MIATRYLVTGAFGFLGAWILRELIDRNLDVVTFSTANDDHRARYLLNATELASIPRVVGDVSDLDAIRHTIQRHKITNIIHLAALQTPSCMANPSRGAQVNVVGTVNVFQAAIDTTANDQPLVYASSVAANETTGHSEGQLVKPSGTTGSHYGVYKRANEDSARVFAQTSGINSIGLRPAVVYGVGRDQGMTSSPTWAMLAAARGIAYTIPFTGACQMQYARDVARAFVAASQLRLVGAAVFDLGGPTVTANAILEALQIAAPAAAKHITAEGNPLSFPAETAGTDFYRANAIPLTSLREGVAETVERFRDLISRGLLYEYDDPGTPNGSPQKERNDS